MGLKGLVRGSQLTRRGSAMRWWHVGASFLAERVLRRHIDRVSTFGTYRALP